MVDPLFRIISALPPEVGKRSFQRSAARAPENIKQRASAPQNKKACFAFFDIVICDLCTIISLMFNTATTD